MIDPNSQRGAQIKERILVDFPDPPRFGPSDEEMFPEVHNPPPDPYSFTSHEERFDLRKMAYRREIPHGLLDVEMRSVEAIMLDAVAAEVRTTMMGKKIPSHEVTRSRSVHVDVFDSPWQHFKDNHKDSWWLRRLVRRHPPTTHRVSHTVTLTAKWEQFVGFPWQDIVSHLDPHRDRLGPALRFADLTSLMSAERTS